MPAGAAGIAVFAHAAGAREAPRNSFLASQLHDVGLATLSLDLLTVEEEETLPALRFDIPRLAERLIAATDWILGNGPTLRLPIGYLAANTGAAAALAAAAQRPQGVFAVVSRGGRPDLAGSALGRVRAPTLLIVGGDDVPVLELNCKALRKLSAAPKRLFVVPGAAHLFREPGALATVARLAADWFVRYLAAAAHPALR